MKRGVQILVQDSAIQDVQYRNAIVSKVHEEDIYDIKFSSGRIKTYIENTSSIKFNSGDYVAVLLSESGGSEICKIIGKGRKIKNTNIIPVVVV